MQRWDLVMTGSDVPENLYRGLLYAGNAFQFFGMPALLGRYFLPSDAPDLQDPQPVAVLSYSLLGGVTTTAIPPSWAGNPARAQGLHHPRGSTCHLALPGWMAMSISR